MKQSNFKKYLTIGVIVVFALITIGYAVFSDGVDSFVAVFRTAKYRFLFPAVGCMIGYWLCEATEMWGLARLLMPRYRYRHAVQTTMIGQLFNCITPFSSGGQPVQIMTMKKHGASIGAATAVQLGRFIVYQSALTLVSVAAVVTRFRFFARQVPRFSMLIFIGLGINLLVMLGLIGVGFFPKITIRFCVWVIRVLHKLHLVKDLDQALQKLDEQMVQFVAGFSFLKANPKRIGITLLLSVLQLCFFFSVPYFVCLSLGASAQAYWEMFCAAAFVLMIASFVPLPGASGGSEGSFLVFFQMFFQSSSKVGLAVLVWRIFTFYLPIVAGSFFTKVKRHSGISILDELHQSQFQEERERANGTEV